MQITLRPFTDADLPIFTAWLHRPHVRPWYTPAEDWLTEIRERDGAYSFIRHFIILGDGAPIGFCQYYPYWLSGEDWHGNLPLEGAYSVDYLIGDPENLRKGYGSAAIRLLAADALKRPDARRVIVQPDTENLASGNALLSAGFLWDSINQLYRLERTAEG